MEAMEKYESISSNSDLSGASMRLFTVWVLVAQAFGLTSVILVAVWMGHFRGGFAWGSDDPHHQFNYHPLFMIIGMVFLFGDAMLVYRVFRNERKVYVKVLHGVLQVLALIFSAVGLKAVFDSHNLAKPDPKPNMYSLHSWLGLATILLFGLQWVMGLVTFLIPGLHQNFRGAYKPIHVFWGIAVYVMAIGSALTGITEKAHMEGHYHEKNTESMIINVLGAVLVAMGMTVGYILTRPEYQRQCLPEEERIALTRD